MRARYRLAVLPNGRLLARTETHSQVTLFQARLGRFQN